MGMFLPVQVMFAIRRQFYRQSSLDQGSAKRGARKLTARGTWAAPEGSNHQAVLSAVQDGESHLPWMEFSFEENLPVPGEPIIRMWTPLAAEVAFSTINPIREN
jgi:hypothetical protein